METQRYSKCVVLAPEKGVTMVTHVDVGIQFLINEQKIFYLDMSCYMCLVVICDADYPADILL